MNIQSHTRQPVSRSLKLGVRRSSLRVLSACVNYAGIHSEPKTADPQQYATQQSLPAEQGHWPPPTGPTSSATRN